MKRLSYILIVDSDILVRRPVAEYMRVCGYRVYREGNQLTGAAIAGVG